MAANPHDFVLDIYKPSFVSWLSRCESNSKTLAVRTLKQQLRFCEGTLCNQCHVDTTTKKNQSALKLYIVLMNRHGIDCDENGVINVALQSSSTMNSIGPALMYSIENSNGMTTLRGRLPLGSGFIGDFQDSGDFKISIYSDHHVVCEGAAPNDLLMKFYEHATNQTFDFSAMDEAIRELV